MEKGSKGAYTFAGNDCAPEHTVAYGNAHNPTFTKTQALLWRWAGCFGPVRCR